MKIKHWSLMLFLLGAINCAWAQDPQYTQFYANPLYLNPGFAGATGDGRVSANYRLQWPNLEASYTTFSASYDQFIGSINSGIGFMVSKDQISTKNSFTTYAGAGTPISNTNLSAFYSYVIPVSETWSIQAGLQAGINMRKLSNNFVFESDLTGQTPNGGGENLLLANPNNFLDFSSGAVLYSENFWIGLAASHLNQPNQSLLSGGTDILPTKISLHAGYKIPLRQITDKLPSGEASLMPVIMYRMQGASDQLDLGIYATFDPIVLGLWYRGLPLKIYEAQDAIVNFQTNRFRSNDALALMVGFKMSNLSIAYSYDATLSSVGWANTGGSHEVSLTYHFNTNHDYANRPRYKRFGRIYCPNPWKLYQKPK